MGLYERSVEVRFNSGKALNYFGIVLALIGAAGLAGVFFEPDRTIALVEEYGSPAAIVTGITGSTLTTIYYTAGVLEALGLYLWSRSYHGK